MNLKRHVRNHTLTILGANSMSLFLYDGTAIRSLLMPSGDGSSPPPLLVVALNVGSYGHFAADDNSIYWASNGQGATEILNCLSDPDIPKRAADAIWDVGIDGTAAYFLAESGDANNPAVSTAWKVAK